MFSPIVNLHNTLRFVPNGTAEATEGGKCKEHTCDVHGLLIAQQLMALFEE